MLLKDAPENLKLTVKDTLRLARGSGIEIDTAIGVACDLGYQSLEELQALGNLIISCFKQLTALIGKQK